MTLNEKTAIITEIAAMPRGSVTLNGRAAIIGAFACDFLKVATLTEPRVSAEFSWPAVARIIRKDGAFRC